MHFPEIKKSIYTSRPENSHMGGLFVKMRWILKDPSDFFMKLYQESHILDSAMYP